MLFNDSLFYYYLQKDLSEHSQDSLESLVDKNPTTLPRQIDEITFNNKYVK